MEAYVEEVRKLEEHFDGLQTEHIPRAEISIVDHLSKYAAQTLPMEPGTFVLHLTQPSVTPSMKTSKRRKLNAGKYFPVGLPEATGKEVVGDNTAVASEQQPPAEHQVLVVEASASAPEEMPLILVLEPQAPAWAQQIVHFLQTGELPNDQEEAEKVARQSSMYQFVDNILHRKRPNGVKLRCICREDGLKLLAEINGGICGSHIGSRALAGKAFQQGFY
jgi:hypothetical protein